MNTAVTAAASESEPRPGNDPRQLGARLSGHLDGVEHDRIEGWAQDPDRPDAKVLIRIFDNGIPITDLPAALYREDLQAAGIGNGEHAFRLELPVPLARSQRHVIEARGADDGRPLVGSPHVLEAEPDLPLLPITDREPAPWRGSLDTVTRERLEGWAWDPRAPEAPMSLSVLDNGEVIAKLVANRYRKDLEGAGVGNGRHGFSLTIPGGLSPLKRHVIQVLGAADGCELPGSPVVIPASGSFDAGLQTAITAAVEGMAAPAERAGALQFMADQMEHLLQQSADAEAGREARLIRQELARRWGKAAFGEASAQSTAVAAAASRRALVIDDLVPMAERDAGSNAVLSHMRALRSLGFDVSFVSAASMNEDQGASAALEVRGIQHCRLPYYASVEEVLRRQADCFDLIYIHRAANAARYLALARHYASRARILYSVADLHFLRLARQAKIEGQPMLANMSTALRQTELSAAARASVVITHSNVEAGLLRKTVAGCNVHVVPWAVPLRPPPIAWEERRGVAFIGSFSHTPNADGARLLVEQIMPRVWRSIPGLPCLLVGSGGGGAIERLAGEHVKVLGHVPQLGTIFDQVRLTAAPLRYGAGVKGKVLDSLAAGIPCIMTPIAAEGIPLPDAIARTVATDTDRFAEQIVRLHQDATAAAEVAQAGRELIREIYSDAAVIELLKAAVEGRRTASR